MVSVLEIALGGAVRVEVEASAEACVRYTVFEGAEAVVSYETITDPRTEAGRMGLRNVVYRRNSGLEKDDIEVQLRERFEEHRSELDSMLGGRP